MIKNMPKTVKYLWFPYCDYFEVKICVFLITASALMRVCVKLNAYADLKIY